MTSSSNIELIEMNTPYNANPKNNTVEEVISLDDVPTQPPQQPYGAAKKIIFFTSAFRPVQQQPPMMMMAQQPPMMNPQQQQAPFAPQQPPMMMMNPQQQQMQPQQQPFQQMPQQAAVPEHRTAAASKTVIKPTNKQLPICNLQPITDEQVSKLLQGLESTYFSQAKMELIQKTCVNVSITCKQAKQVLDAFTISFEKKQLIQSVFQFRLADPQQLDSLLVSFEFELDRLLCQQMLQLITINFF